MKDIFVEACTQEELLILGRAMLKILLEPGKQFCLDVVNKSDGRKAHFHVMAVRVEEKGSASHGPH